MVSSPSTNWPISSPVIAPRLRLRAFQRKTAARVLVPICGTTCPGAQRCGWYTWSAFGGEIPYEEGRCRAVLKTK